MLQHMARAGVARARAKPGGWGGIRTHGTVARTSVFKTDSLNHSDTHPRTDISDIKLYCKQKLRDNLNI